MAKTKEEQLAAARAWKARNQERVRAYRAKYWTEHRDKEKANFSHWVKSNPARWRELQKIDAAKHGAVRRARRRPQHRLEQNKRYAEDPRYRIEKRIRASFNQALRRVKVSKTTSIRILIGCSMEELRTYLEARFQPGMNWTLKIHIDHIRPCASFDLMDPEQQRQCFHYTNLQPLWAADNIKKSDSL